MRRTWTFPAAAASLVLTQAAAPSAVADGSGFIIGPAAFLQFTFGQRWDIGLGLEVRSTWRFEDFECAWHTSQKGLGAFAQAIVLFREPRYQINVGLHAGVQPEAGGLAWVGELAWMWRESIDEIPGGHGLQLGFVMSDAPFDYALRGTLYHDGEAWIPEGHVSAGGGLFGALGTQGGECIVGRPQRGDGGDWVLGRIWARRGRQRPSVGCGRRAAGVAWAEAARAEAASVPAFLALARDLKMVGAPGNLVERALRAASDEVRHTKVCARIARRLLGTPLRVEMPAVAPAAPVGPANRSERLVGLAVASFVDGMVNEGGAAGHARAGAQVAGSRRVRRALRQNARDERGHATLADAVVAWCVEAGGAPVIAALQAVPVVSGGVPGAGPDTPRVDTWLWRRCGRPAPAVAAHAHRKAVLAAVQARARLVVGGPLG